MHLESFVQVLQSQCLLLHLSYSGRIPHKGLGCFVSQLPHLEHSLHYSRNMAGIAIHTQDPIKPDEGQTGSPTASAAEVPPSHRRQRSVNTAASRGYQPAQVTSAPPTPTQPTGSACNEPMLPKPGASPTPYAPAGSNNATLPPPPKAGEKPQPPSFYAPPSSPRSHVPPMSYKPSQSSVKRASRGSVTSVSPTSPTFAGRDHHRTTSMSNEPSLEHPPGYIQNPYASDMTPEQRFAVLQEEQGQQKKVSTDLGYTPSRSRAGSSASPILDWASQTGGKLAGQLGELHEKFWESVEGKR